MLVRPRLLSTGISGAGSCVLWRQGRVLVPVRVERADSGSVIGPLERRPSGWSESTPSTVVGAPLLSPGLRSHDADRGDTTTRNAPPREPTRWRSTLDRSHDRNAPDGMPRRSGHVALPTIVRANEAATTVTPTMSASIIVSARLAPRRR